MILGAPDRAGQGRASVTLFGVIAAVIVLLAAGHRHSGAAEAAPRAQPPQFLFPWASTMTVWLTSGPHNGSYPIGSPDAPVDTRAALDFGRGPEHWPVLASAAGTVVKAGCSLPGWEGYGCLVELDHGDGWQTLYTHFYKNPTKDVGLRLGDEVPAGTLIGHAGETGHAYGIHLHWELRHGGKRVAGKWQSGEMAPIDGLIIEGWTVHASKRNYEGTMTKPGEPRRTATSSCMWVPGSACPRNDLTSTNTDNRAFRVGAGDAAVVTSSRSGFAVLSGAASTTSFTGLAANGALVKSTVLDAGGVPDAERDGGAVVATWWDAKTGATRMKVLSPGGRVLRDLKLPGGPRPAGPLRVAADGAGAYLAAWYATEPGDGGNVYAVVIDRNGRLGRVLAIAVGPGAQQDPDVGFDPLVGRYVIAWADGGRGAIIAAGVTASGAVTSPYLVSATTVDARHPAFSTNGIDLVVAWEQDGKGRDIAVRGIDGQAALGEPLPIASSGSDETEPALAWDEASEQFIAAWTTGRGARSSLAWRAITSRAAPVGHATIVPGGAATAGPSIACDHGVCVLTGVDGGSVLASVLAPD